MAQFDQSLRELTGYRLRRSTISMQSNMRDIFAEFGLRRTTYSTLALVVANPGLRQSQLAETLGIERPNFVQIVNELEKAGLVSRKKAKGDKRAYAMEATPAGCALFSRASGAVRRFDEKLTAGLSADQIQMLHHALNTIEINANRREADHGS